MARIVYIVLPTQGRLTGGIKMAVRHVEALNALGFDAAILLTQPAPLSQWLAHRAPILTERPRADDILVVPEDAPGLQRRLASSPHRKVLFCQNQFYAMTGIGIITDAQRRAYGEVMACSATAAHWVSRYLPHASVTIVPAFADERVFRPAAKRPMVACSPRKRPFEEKYIREAFRHLFRGAPEFEWVSLASAREEDVAKALGAAAVFLSLSRFEALGITTLEAMASGCVIAGFPGVGGLEYASRANGFWAHDDDCEAAAVALTSAAQMFVAQDPELPARLQAGFETAERWSRAAFVTALEKFWASTTEARRTHPAKH